MDRGRNALGSMGMGAARSVRRLGLLAVLLALPLALLELGGADQVAAPAAMSGSQIPTANLASSTASDARRWEVVLDEDFDSEKLASVWSVYTGRPTSDPWTRWSADRVRVDAGRLVLSGAPTGPGSQEWTTGGVSAWRLEQTYGRWTVTFRARQSSVLSHHFLLWPAAENWPPEVDIAESFSAERTSIDAFVHYRNLLGERQKQRRTIGGDFTKWNTVTIEWTPFAIDYFLNGEPFWRVRGQAVPQQPMFLALQTETQLCDRARRDCSADAAGAQPSVEIDRVVIERLR